MESTLILKNAMDVKDNISQPINYFVGLKLFPLVSMAYVTFSIDSMVVAYKIINIFGVIITGSSLVMPFRYLMADIISELYGYYLAKKNDMVPYYLLVYFFVY